MRVANKKRITAGIKILMRNMYNDGYELGYDTNQDLKAQEKDKR